MVADWSALAQTAIGAAAAIGGGFAGAWWQARGQLRIERDRRRERAAEILGEVALLLDDADRKFKAIWHIPGQEVMGPLAQRHQSLRNQLFVLAAAHPSRRVWTLSRQLEEALFQVIIGIEIWIDDRRGDQPGHEAAKATAQEDHATAVRLLEQLHTAI
jgi:hypothetical protein